MLTKESRQGFHGCWLCDTRVEDVLDRVRDVPAIATSIGLWFCDTRSIQFVVSRVRERAASRGETCSSRMSKSRVAARENSISILCPGPSRDGVAP